MSQQEHLGFTILEERVSALEKQVKNAQATASGSLGLAGVAFAYVVFWLISG